MKTTLASILMLLALCGCKSDNFFNSGVPLDEWPDFIPLSKIEHYLGFPYPTPSLGKIYGGLKNVKVVAESESASLLIPGKPIEPDGFVSLEYVPERIGLMRPILYRTQLTTQECKKLKDLFLFYDSFGDETLGHSEPDVAFRFVVQNRWVDVVLGFELEEVDISSDNGCGECRCISPEVVKYAKQLYSKYYKKK
jgi:hypothetical protein